jgi:hypothetical protein
MVRGGLVLESTNTILLSKERTNREKCDKSRKLKGLREKRERRDKWELKRNETE